MTDRDFILAPQAVTVSVALEPVYNALTTLMLLSSVDHDLGVSDWVVKTAAGFSAGRRWANRVVCGHLSLINATLPDESWPSMPAWIDQLATRDPVALRDQAMKWVCNQDLPIIGRLDRDKLLGDHDLFLRVMEQLHVSKGKEFDVEFYSEMHTLLNDPERIKAITINHLREMWEEILAPEWRRVQPLLQESVNAFQQIDFTGMSAVEAARVITGRDLSTVWEEWADRIIFVPSAHIGPYVMRFDSETQRLSWIVFGARQPEGAKSRSAALSRSELLVQLNALADDIRLRILELLTEHEELCAQDIITMLDLSQSSASRHLRQLTASGYITERRREVSKCYTLNLSRVDGTLHALKSFLNKK